jgi:chromosome segregation ATPase
VGNIQLIYVLPMIVGPILAAIGGWMTAWLQYRQQKTAGSGDRLLRFVNEMQEELQRTERRIEAMGKQLSTARDVLLQIVDLLPEIKDTAIKDRLMHMIREGLRAI